MKMQCPRCGVKGSIDDSYAGRKIRCPKCKEMFQADAEVALDLEGMAGQVEDVPVENIEQGLDPQEGTSQEETRADVTAVEEVQAAADSSSEDSVEDELLQAQDDEVDTVQQEVAPEEVASAAQDGSLIMKVKCVTCGKYRDTDELFMEIDGLPYCARCGSQEEDELSTSALAAAVVAGGAAASAAMSDPESSLEQEDKQTETQSAGFAIGGVIRKAWDLTSGIKGAIWGGLLITCGLILALTFGLGVLTAITGQFEAGAVELVSELVLSVLSTILTGGLMFMGVKKALGRKVIWKDVFSGFKVSGKIVIATFLQMFLITIGFLLLVLPGIYLMVGYFLTIPLIIEQKMSPWQAMEASRKAIHNVWWKICGLYFVVGLIIVVSAIPAGIGLIWTLPMSVVLVGVVYTYLFPAEKKAD